MTPKQTSLSERPVSACFVLNLDYFQQNSYYLVTENVQYS